MHPPHAFRHLTRDTRRVFSKSQNLPIAISIVERAHMCDCSTTSSAHLVCAPVHATIRQLGTSARSSTCCKSENVHVVSLGILPNTQQGQDGSPVRNLTVVSSPAVRITANVPLPQSAKYMGAQPTTQGKAHDDGSVAPASCESSRTMRPALLYGITAIT